MFSALSLLFSLASASADWTPGRVYQCSTTFAKVADRSAPLRPGSKIVIGVGHGLNAPHAEVTFLGTEVTPSGDKNLLFVNIEQGALYRINHFSLMNAPKAADDAPTFLSIPAQVGETCAAHSTNNCVAQLSGYSHKERDGLLAQAIDYMYTRAVPGKFSAGYGKLLDAQHVPYTWARSNEENGLGKLLDHLRTGRPAVIDYSGGVESFKVAEYELDPTTTLMKVKRRKRAARLVPKPDGPYDLYSYQTGHSVMAVGTFELEGKPAVIVLDSDGPRLRIWREEDFRAFTTPQRYLLVGAKPGQ